MKIVNFITHSKLESALGYKKDYVTVRIMPDDFERFRTSFPGSGMRTTDSAVLMFSLNKDLVDYKYNGKSQTLPKRVKEGYFVGLIEKAREWTFQTPFVQGLRKTVGLTSNPPFYAHNLYEKKTHGLNLKQMRRLYAMVSRGNQKAITYARNVLGIPFSESPTQVKAVVYHHVRDLAERRVRRNPASSDVTPVVFRTFRSGGEVIALFPYEPGTMDPGTMMSYQHIGQHGPADMGLTAVHTRPSTPDEIRPLKNELERIGYKLKILKRIPGDAVRVRAEKIRSMR